MKIAFLSISDLTDFVVDDELAFEPLQALGYTVDTLFWQQTSIPWNEYAAVIIRSTWDYQNHLAAFLEVLKEIEANTLLANPLEIVRWNADKIYLKDLAEKGAIIVPTIWVNNKIGSQHIDQWFDQLASDELIIKPTISANAQDTFRLKHDNIDLTLLNSTFDQRACMVQPFMPTIIDEGEFSLFYFNGQYSHAILKTPKATDFRVQEEHGGIIQAITPDDNLLAAGAKVLQCIPTALLYARVDLVRTQEDQFAVMEVELIEPALYLRMAPQAPTLFAQAVHNWLLQNQ